MCYHKSQTNSIDYLADYYSVSYEDTMKDLFTPRYHENGFDFLASPIVTVEHKDQLLPYYWGLIPWWTKGIDAGLKLRIQTLNCISEEMYDKPSFRDSANDGKRCLIPCSGFFEWRWLDEKGKSKVPYYVRIPNHQLFSIAGLYSTYKDKATDKTHYTYTVLTTKANSLMEKIHNSKKRMPVIIPREYELDWLNPNLSKDDVLALCQPIPSDTMDGYTISKLITSKKEETDVQKVIEPEHYHDVSLADGGSSTNTGGGFGASSEGSGGSGSNGDGLLPERPKKTKITKPKAKDKDDKGQTSLF